MYSFALFATLSIIISPLCLAQKTETDLFFEGSRQEAGYLKLKADAEKDPRAKVALDILTRSFEGGVFHSREEIFFTRPIIIRDRLTQEEQERDLTKTRTFVDEIQVILNLEPFPHIALMVGRKIYSYGQDRLEASTPTGYLLSKTAKIKQQAYVNVIRREAPPSEIEKLDQAKGKYDAAALKRAQELGESGRDPTKNDVQDLIELHRQWSEISRQIDMNVRQKLGEKLAVETEKEEKKIEDETNPTSFIALTLKVDDPESFKRLKRYYNIWTGWGYRNVTTVNDCATMIRRALEVAGIDFGEDPSAFDTSPTLLFSHLMGQSQLPLVRVHVMVDGVREELLQRVPKRATRYMELRQSLPGIQEKVAQASGKLEALRAANAEEFRATTDRDKRREIVKRFRETDDYKAARKEWKAADREFRKASFKLEEMQRTLSRKKGHHRLSDDTIRDILLQNAVKQVAEMELFKYSKGVWSRLREDFDQTYDFDQLHFDDLLLRQEARDHSKDRAQRSGHLRDVNAFWNLISDPKTEASRRKGAAELLKEVLADSIKEARDFTNASFTSSADIFKNVHLWHILRDLRNKWMPELEPGWTPPKGEKLFDNDEEHALLEKLLGDMYENFGLGS